MALGDNFTDFDTGPSRKNPTAAKDEEGEKPWPISCSIGTAQVATVVDNLILARTCGASLSYFVAILFILTLPMIHGYSLLYFAVT